MGVAYADLSNGSRSDLGKRVALVLKALKKNNTYINVKQRTICKELSKLLSDEMNGDMTVYIDPSIRYNANAKILMLDNNNPFLLRSWVEGYTEGLDGASEEQTAKNTSNATLRGGFDFRSNKFFGWMSNVKQELTLAHNFIYPTEIDSCVENEVTAILFHEIGHNVQFLYGTGHSVFSNYILNFAHNEMMGSTTTSKRVDLLNRIIDGNKLDIFDDVNYIAKMNDNKLTSTVLIGALRTKHRIELGEDSYGYVVTGAESLADYFATNHGFGLDLISGLGKIGTNSVARRNQQLKLWLETSFILTCSFLAASVTPAGGFIAALVLMSNNFSPDQNTYDTSSDRSKRIVNTMIKNLKNNRGGDNTQRIKEIESALFYVEAMQSDTRGIYQYLNELFTSKGRRRASARDLEKILESLASNKLYLKAERFSNF